MTTSSGAMTTDPIVLQLGYLHGVLKAQTADLTEEESLFQPRGGCNCLNWLLGHIVVSRNQMLGIVGKPAVLDARAAARYARGSEPITGPGPEVLELSRLLEAYEEAQAPIQAGFEAMSEEDLAATVPWFGGDLDKRGALAGLLFHEAYHVGQVGLIRRLLGRPSAIGV